MPMDRSRYPKDWSQISFKRKDKAKWCCQGCGKQCLKPGDPVPLSKSERAKKTLTTHHADFTPENNREDNLIPLCAPCHLRAHAGRKRNVPPGQLSLF